MSIEARTFLFDLLTTVQQELRTSFRPRTPAAAAKDLYFKKYFKFLNCYFVRNFVAHLKTGSSTVNSTGAIFATCPSSLPPPTPVADLNILRTLGKASFSKPLLTPRKTPGGWEMFELILFVGKWTQAVRYHI